MLEILNDIKKACKADALRSAYALALTLPDICGQIEYPQKSCKERYSLWIDNFLEETENNGIIDIIIADKESQHKAIKIDGAMYYKLRCQYLHAGNTDLMEENGEGIDFQFVITGTQDEGYYANLLFSIKDKKVLLVDIRNEINKLVHSAINYYKNHGTKGDFSNHTVEIMDMERNLECIKKNDKKSYDCVKKVTAKLIKSSKIYE